MATTEPRPSLRVVVVTHDSADHVVPALAALTRQLGTRDELVVVDTASADETCRVVRDAVPVARVIELDDNAGFAGGAVAGARGARTDLLLFLNPDAIAEPGCIDALRAAALEHPAWSAWQAMVLLPGGARVNTGGGVVHWLGIAWSGGYDRSVEDGEAPREVGFASGAALVVRREAWEATGGFDAEYFMYYEDVDLSLRLRLAGGEVGVVPAARVIHEYAFEKGAYKWFHLERNRWWTILAAYPAPLLALVLPALLAFELALMAVAARDGWLGAKLRAQGAVLRGLPRAMARRRAVQATRRVSTATFVAGLSDRLDSPFLGNVASLSPVVATQAAYWRLVRAILGASRDAAVTNRR